MFNRIILILKEGGKQGKEKEEKQREGERRDRGRRRKGEEKWRQLIRE